MLIEPLGAVAQLVARLVRIEEVRGSIPLSSTDLVIVRTTPFGAVSAGRAGADPSLLRGWGMRKTGVEIHPSQGVYVAPTSIEAQLKVLELRRSMEELAVRLAAHRATTQQRERILELAEVLSEFDGDDPQRFGELLKSTHTLILEAAHNEYLSVAMAPCRGSRAGSGSPTCAIRRRNWPKRPTCTGTSSAPSATVISPRPPMPPSG